MTIPYREWLNFDIVTLEGHDTNVGTFNIPAYWTNVYRDYGIVGGYEELEGPPNSWWLWYTLVRPSADDFGFADGADIPANYRFDFRLTRDSWEAHPCTDCDIEFLLIDNPGSVWLSDSATGKYTDGTATEWDAPYPVHGDFLFSDLVDCRPGTDPPLQTISHNILRTDVVGEPTPSPLLIQVEMPSNFVAQEACDASARLFNNGILLRILGFCGGNVSNLGVGNQITLSVFPDRLKVKYFNPVANSFSRYRIPVAGGVALVITGMGFDNDHDEIDDLCGVDADTQWGAELTVSEIKFYTTAGVLAGTITTPLLQFTVDSDTQITIPATTMTALGLAEGTYHVLLSKGILTDCGTTEAYAGDWRADNYGRMREGTRFVLLVSDEAVDGEGDGAGGGDGGKGRAAVPRFKWTWKRADDEVFAYYAPIDTRGEDIFWEGRVKNITSITRSIDDRTGLFSASDAEVTLSNADKEMSKMLSRYWLKNQLVEFYYGWGSQPDAWHEYFFRGIVDDYVLGGIHFDVTIRDLAHKYSQISVPQLICTETDYPDIHESSVGRNMPEALGLCSLIPAVASETSGEVEAVYVDTTGPPYSYLAAHFPLHSIPQVYSDNVLMTTPANYTVAYRDVGRTYIDFMADQGDNKITFNCTGYSVVGWDDPTNGYIQNPAYIISFFLTQIMGTPLNLLDMESFDDLAALYTTNGWHQAGKFILQSERDSMEVLKELLFSFGANLWIAKDGRLTIGRKDTTNYATSLIVFEQIHAKAHAEKQFNLNEAANWANIRWDYVPTHTLFKSAKEESTASSIADYEKEMEPSTPWNLPWNISDDFVEQRIVEELLKYAYGYRKIKVTVPIAFIDDLDIFTNFRYQDPFGLSWTKAGEQGRYYYVSSLTYDFQAQTIDVEAVDMQYLLSQCLIVNTCATPRRIWPGSTGTGSEASPEERMFAFVGVCATGQLPGGTRNKKVCKCQSQEE